MPDTRSKRPTRRQAKHHPDCVRSPVPPQGVDPGDKEMEAELLRLAAWIAVTDETRRLMEWEMEPLERIADSHRKQMLLLFDQAHAHKLMGKRDKEKLSDLIRILAEHLFGGNDDAELSAIYVRHGGEDYTITPEEEIQFELEVRLRRQEREAQAQRLSDDGDARDSDSDMPAPAARPLEVGRLGPPTLDELRRHNAMLEFTLKADYGFPYEMELTPRSLLRLIREDIAKLEAMVGQIKDDLVRFQRIKSLKAWLKTSPEDPYQPDFTGWY